MNATDYINKTRAIRKLRLARRDFPLREIILTIVLIAFVWALDVFVVRRSYDRNYFLVVHTARQKVAHCRDMVVNRLRPKVYRVLTCNKAYFYEVEGERARLVKVQSTKEGAWAN